MKKIALHTHFDGSVRPDYAAKLLGRDVTKEMTYAGGGDLADFLTMFKLPLELLQTEEHLTEAAYMLAEDLAEDGVIYAEIRFCPLLHIQQGLTPRVVVNAVWNGLRQARDDLGIRTGLILCMMRNFSFAQNVEIINLASNIVRHKICGIDLAGDERARPNMDPEFSELFRRVFCSGIPYTIHAGEAVGPESVEAAVVLGASRLGHGVRAIESPETVELLVKQQIPIEVCPTSNVLTSIHGSIKESPIRKLMGAGVLVTIDTDNRTVCGTTLT